MNLQRLILQNYTDKLMPMYPPPPPPPMDGVLQYYYNNKKEMQFAKETFINEDQMANI